MTIHSNDFHERLARIEAGGANRRHMLYVGMDESYVVPPRPKVAKQVTLIENLGYSLSRVFALTLGGLMVFAVLIGRYWLDMAAPIPGDPLNDQVLDGILALSLAVFIGRRLHDNREGLVGLHSTGVLLTIVGWHNLVHWLPGLFDMIVSPMWTSVVLSSTEINSIVVRGVSIPLL